LQDALDDLAFDIREFDVLSPKSNYSAKHTKQQYKNSVHLKI